MNPVASSSDATATTNLRLAMARMGGKTDPVALVGKPVQDAPAAPPAAPAAMQTASLKVGFGPGLAPSVNAPATQVDSMVAPVATRPVPSTPVDVAPEPVEASAVEAAPTAALAPPSARLEISNGNGVTGMAARVGRWLAKQGIATQRLTNQRPFAQALTIVQYRAGHEEAAQRIARSMPAEAKADTQPTPGLRSDVRVVLGHDWVKAAACLATDSCPAGAGAVALADR